MSKQKSSGDSKLIGKTKNLEIADASPCKLVSFGLTQSTDYSSVRAKKLNFLPWPWKKLYSMATDSRSSKSSCEKLWLWQKKPRCKICWLGALSVCINNIFEVLFLNSVVQKMNCTDVTKLVSSATFNNDKSTFLTWIMRCERLPWTSNIHPYKSNNSNTPVVHFWKSYVFGISLGAIRITNIIVIMSIIKPNISMSNHDSR